MFCTSGHGWMTSGGEGGRGGGRKGGGRKGGKGGKSGPEKGGGGSVREGERTEGQGGLGRLERNALCVWLLSLTLLSSSPQSLLGKPVGRGELPRPPSPSLCPFLSWHHPPLHLPPSASA